MSTIARKLPITAAEYLEGERKSDVRHEFVDGRIYAMSGASLRHNEICGDVFSLLKNHLRGGPCRTFIEAVKVELADDLTEAYYYPDVFVSALYQTATFPDDVERPWYLRHREDG